MQFIFLTSVKPSTVLYTICSYKRCNTITWTYNFSYINALPSTSLLVDITVFANDTIFSRGADILSEALSGLSVAQMEVEQWFGANSVLMEKKRTPGSGKVPCHAA